MAKPAAGKPPALSSARVYGDYLAGRQAQHRRDFANAAKFYEKALAVDPDSPELISRTFLMEVLTGNFERAAILARTRAEAGSERRGRPSRDGRGPASLRRFGRRAQGGRRAAVRRRAPFHRPVRARLDPHGGGRSGRRRNGAAGARQIQRLRAAEDVSARAPVRLCRQAGQGAAVLRQGDRRERAVELAGDRNRRQFRGAAGTQRAGAGALRPLRPREQQQRSGDRGRRDPRRRSAEAADLLRLPTGSPRRCSISPAC